MIENKLVGAIKARRQQLCEEVLDRPVQQMEKYTYLVGLYNGLGEALDMLDALLNEAEERDF